MEEIVGPDVFSEAKESLNRRLTNREKLLTKSPDSIALRKEGTLQGFIKNEIDN